MVLQTDKAAEAPLSQGFHRFLHFLSVYSKSAGFIGICLPDRLRHKGTIHGEGLQILPCSCSSLQLSHENRPCQASLPLQAPWILQLRSKEHTSELRSRENLVCRLLLEKK